MGLLVFWPAAEAGEERWLELNIGHDVPGYALGWFSPKEIPKRLEMWLGQAGTAKAKIRAHPLWRDLEASRPFALRVGGNSGLGTSEIYSLARRIARERGADLRSSAPPVIHK